MAIESSHIETIRLSVREKQKLVEYIEQSGKKTVDNERRSLRVDFHGRIVLVTIINSHGQKVGHSVLPRNLSRRGLAFVHGRFVYPDSRCLVTLPMQNGKWTAVEGFVRNCRHIQGIIHEVSVVFDEALDLNQFVRLTASEKERHRTEVSRDSDPESDLDVNTVGRALVIDDMATDRKLHRMWLGKLNLTTNEASGATTTTEQMAHGQFDMILINLELGEESGPELIQHLRSQGYERPIIATSASESTADKEAAIAAGASAFLVKPFTLEDLRGTVEDTLSIDTSDTSASDGVFSSMNEDEDMLPLIQEFVSSLGPLTMRLRRANADNDLELINQICQNLKGAGAGYGFDAITTMARYALDSVENAEQDAEGVRKTVNDLVGMLRRTRPGVQES